MWETTWPPLRLTSATDIPIDADTFISKLTEVEFALISSCVASIHATHIRVAETCVAALDTSNAETDMAGRLDDVTKVNTPNSAKCTQSSNLVPSYYVNFYMTCALTTRDTVIVTASRTNTST